MTRGHVTLVGSNVPTPTTSTILASALLMLALGCKAESNLASEDDPPPARPSEEYAEFPELAPTPSGVPAEVWGDIGWFPSKTMEISGYPRGSSLDVVELLRSEAVDLDLPECIAPLDGINRYYKVGDESNVAGQTWSRTLVFYGDLDRNVIETCARKYIARLGGGKFSHFDTMTSIGLDEDESRLYLGWMRRGGETIVVADASLERVDAFLATRLRLERHAEFIELLRRATFDTRTWTVGRQNYGKLMLGVENLGHVFTSEVGEVDGGTRAHFVGKLVFPSPAEASAAKAGAEQLDRRLTEFGIETTATTRAEADVLHFDVDLDVREMAPEKLPAFVQLLMAESAAADGKERPELAPGD